ncbi:hypothetical protein CCP4SC76_600025 [Gammaproteobacteria bacterium]
MPVRRTSLAMDTANNNFPVFPHPFSRFSRREGEKAEKAPCPLGEGLWWGVREGNLISAISYEAVLFFSTGELLQ